MRRPHIFSEICTLKELHSGKDIFLSISVWKHPLQKSSLDWTLLLLLLNLSRLSTSLRDSHLHSLSFHCALSYTQFICKEVSQLSLRPVLSPLCSCCSACGVPALVLPQLLPYQWMGWFNEGAWSIQLHCLQDLISVSPRSEKATSAPITLSTHLSQRAAPANPMLGALLEAQHHHQRPASSFQEHHRMPRENQQQRLWFLSLVCIPPPPVQLVGVHAQTVTRDTVIQRICQINQPL